MVTSGGEPVLSSTHEPIPVPLGEVSVGMDGVLSVEGGAVATVGVFTFPAGTQLVPEGANRYVAPAGVAGTLSRNATIHGKSIEAANQDVIQGTLDLIMMQRQQPSIVLGAVRAHAVDSRRVEVTPFPDEDVAALLDKVEAVEVEVFPRARVVVNERTGTVVIGGTVRLQPVSILHGGLSVNVIAQNIVSQPNALSSGTTQVVQQTSVQAQDKPVNRIDLKEGATVEDLVQELQRTGAGARDVISILQAMKEAGALEAELEVL